MFARIKKRGPVLRRMKKVRDNDIIFIRRFTNETPRIGDLDRDIRGVEWRTGWVRKKVRNDRDNFRKKFDSIRMQVWVRGAGAERDASAESQDKRAPRIRVQQQRNISVPQFRNRRRRSAHLETVVHKKCAVPVRSLSDADRGHATVANFANGRTRLHPHERIEGCDIWQNENWNYERANHAATAIPHQQCSKGALPRFVRKLREQAAHKKRRQRENGERCQQFRSKNRQSAFAEGPSKRFVNRASRTEQ